jgi:hypothetical protein
MVTSTRYLARIVVEMVGMKRRVHGAVDDSFAEGGNDQDAENF